MRHNKNSPAYKLGTLVMSLGALVLLAIVLPTSFWWLITGGVLIYLGTWIKRCF